MSRKVVVQGWFQCFPLKYWYWIIQIINILISVHYTSCFNNDQPKSYVLVLWGSMQLSQYTNIQYLQRKYNAQQFLKAMVKSWPVGMGTEELAKELLSRVILCMLRMLRAFAMAKGWVNFWMFLAFVKVFRRWVNLWMFFQICEGFLDDGWISERFWRLSRRDGSISECFSDLWRFFTRWVNFWMFFRFVKVF